MTDLSWHQAKFERITAQKKRYSPDAKPPQDQCTDKDGHPSHTYPCDKGLIWSCQGRSSREVVRLAEDTVSKAAGAQALGGSIPSTSA